MKKNVVWTCDYCGKDFDTKSDCDKHEITCSKNPKNTKFPYNSNPKRAWLITWITTILVFAVSLLISSNFSTQSSYLLANKWLSGLFLGNIGLGIVAFFAMAFSENKPKNNKFSSIIKYSLLICFIYLFINPLIFAVEGYKNQHKTELNKAVTTDTMFPVDKLELQNIKYDGKILTGSILNKDDKAAFNTEILLRVSKDKSSWSVEEQHDFTVPYKIDPGKSINFSENFRIAKANPWSSSYIVKAQYYNGEDVLIPSSTPTPKSIPKKIINPTTIPVDIDPMINCTMNINCGGGVRKVKKSECDNGTCCQIGSSWIFYTSRQKCTEDQNKYNSNYTYPTYAPYPTYKPIPTYSYVAPTVYATPTMSQEQAQSIIDQHNSQVSLCRGQVVSNYEGLLKSCGQYAGSAAEVCSYEIGKQRQSAYDNCGVIY